MFAINDEMITARVAEIRTAPQQRRCYRGRNRLEPDTGLPGNNAGAHLPADPPFWDDMIGASVRVGVQSARKTLKPALGIWGLMAILALAYYFVPAAAPLFTGLMALQNSLGILFPSLGMGLSVGVMVEVVKVALSKRKRWTSRNTQDAFFNFLVFGLMGLSSYYRYPFQDEIFGSGNSWSELTAKVCFDQFVWTVLLANPYQAIVYLWKNSGYSWKAVRSRALPFRSFWGTQMLPVLIANWAFWIPMAFLVYSFPLMIQLPLSILAVTIWVMLLTILTSQTHRHDS